MQINKAKFLAIGIATAFVVLSSGVQAQETNAWGEQQQVTQNNSGELSQTASNFFSRMGSAIKSGVQTVGNTTGQVMQKTGKGIQNLAESAENMTLPQAEAAPAPQSVNKVTTQSNIKQIRSKSTQPKNDKVQNYLF